MSSNGQSQQQQQIEEIQLLQSSLTSEEFRWRPTAPGEAEAWDKAVQDGSEASSNDLSPFAFSLRLSESPALHLDVDLPKTQGKEPVTHLKGSVENIDAITAATETRLRESREEDIEHRIFDLFTYLQDYLQDHPPIASKAENPIQDDKLSDKDSATAAESTSIPMLRLIIWSHHLLAPSKRRDLSSLCSSLRLWGLFKVGYPGYLCFEGRTSDVEEALKEVKTWQWHAIAVRLTWTWTFQGNDEEEALLQCKLAKGNSHFEGAKTAKKKGEKVRTGGDEVEGMKDIVDRLRGAGIPEEEVIEALGLRTKGGHH